MLMRQVPLDGVNRILDVTIKHYIDSQSEQFATGIQIVASSKEREQTLDKTEHRTMNISIHDWKAFNDVLREAERIILPPAIEDHKRDDPTIASFIADGDVYKYKADIVFIHGPHGSERILQISQEKEKDRHFQGFAIPWRYTTVFFKKYESVRQETVFMINDQQRMIRGMGKSSNLHPMAREELLQSEESLLKFQN